jgi:hypothetical protein
MGNMIMMMMTSSAVVLLSLTLRSHHCVLLAT